MASRFHLLWTMQVALPLAVTTAGSCRILGDDLQVHPPSTPLILNDRHGTSNPVATNDWLATVVTNVPGTQIPTPYKGSPQSDSVQQRITASKDGRQWFPRTPPVLMPYLANLDEFGNTALQPGAVLSIPPLDRGAQSVKEELSDAGLRYTFYQSVTMLGFPSAEPGVGTLGYYTATYVGTWAITEDPASGRAGWLSTEFNVQLGLSAASRSWMPQDIVGSVVNPQATVFGPDGLWISELAWQQSFMEGNLVVLAGQLDQSNYLDSNLYANNSQGQFLNSSFVNSQVLPLPYNNLGLNLQYQTSRTWYAIVGIGANNQGAGTSPFADLSFQDVSYMLELGLTPADVLGLGPGVVRLQPFVATVDGVTQAGVSLNLQQRLGPQSPLGWFGRFGVGGNQVTLDGACAQIATGIVFQAPLQYTGLCPRLSNDTLGVGLVWSRPSDAVADTVHQNEWGLELVYVLQLTPLVSVEPDVQVVWNPAANAVSDRSVILQLQVNLTL